MRKFFIGVAVALLIAGAATAAPSSAGSDQQQGASPQVGINCFKTFQSGSGNAFFRWCITSSGNVLQLESPVTFEHIRVGTFIEGYALCYPGFAAYDNAQSGVNWGPPSFQAPNKITRVTSNGRFRLATVFTQDAPNRRVVMRSTLTNISGSSQGGLQLSRFVDGDIDNDTDDDIYVRTQASVIGTDEHGLQLIGTTFNNPHFTQIESFGDLADDTGCSATTPLPSPTTAGDAAGRYTYNAGALGPNQAKTFVYEYRLI
jgi:hypothetical protein